MIICIDINFKNVSFISSIIYTASQDYRDLISYANRLKEYYEEVYIIDIDNYHAPFIEEIRKRGHKI